tara:strand:+ start:16246 stop:16638 length:393 start_codon:yes stop_codon:yes gene_type:complete
MSASPSLQASSFNETIGKIKLGELPFEAIYQPFLDSEFFVLVDAPIGLDSVTPGQFKFHMIELRNEPMVVLGESREILVSNFVTEKISAIKIRGRDLVNSIHPEVGVTFIWEEGGFSFPVALVKELREKH